MVERPIKKSERQSQPSTDNNSENSDSIPPIESNIESKPKISKPGPTRSSDKGKSDKGKKASFGDENRQQHGNPALARGPKPVKPPTPVKTEPEGESEGESEPVSEESPD